MLRKVLFYVMMNYKISLKSKRIESGKCQIKFTVSDTVARVTYGSLLSEPGATLKEVVIKIEQFAKTKWGGERVHPSRLS